MAIEPRELEVLNQALDHDRARRGLPNDVSLSVAYGIAPKTLSEWRTGKWTKADAILINVLVRFVAHATETVTA